MDRLESGDLDKRSAPKTIAKALLKVDNEEFKKPLFRAMTLILIASSMSDNRESKDRIIKDEDDYYDVSGFHSFELNMPICIFEYHTVFYIAINYQNQLLIRGKIFDDPNLISDELTKYITNNRGLTRAETRICLQDNSYKGMNYPFYSNNTLEEIEENLEMSLHQLKEVIETPGVHEDMIEFKYMQYIEWYEKLESIRLSKRKTLEEIEYQSVIEVKFNEETSEVFKEKVYEEIFKSIYALRNKESMELFGEGFETIQARQNIFLNDFNKLRLIEVLFPVRITENPEQFYPVVEAVPVEATDPPIMMPSN
jgi:hypothetical protein